jgi:hypothetical protein
VTSALAPALAASDARTLGVYETEHSDNDYPALPVRDEDVVERTVVLIRYFQSQAAGLLQGSGSGSHWEKIHAARTKSVARFLVDNPGSGRGDVMAMGPEWAMDGRLVDRILEDCKTLGVWRG